MSRLRVFMLLATVVALAGMLGACGGGSDGGDDEPQQILEDATLEGVKSGTIDLTLAIKSQGKEGGDLDLSLSGPFQNRGAGALPLLGLEISAIGDVNGENIDFVGGLTLLADRAFIDYDGTVYEVDPTTFGFVRSSFEQAQGGGEDSGGPTACQEAFAAIDLSSVVDNLKSQGGVDVEGTPTTKVSGDLDSEGASDAIAAVTEDPACSSQLEAAPLPLDELEESKEELSDGLQEAQVDVYVGDDDIVRRIDAAITIEPKDESGEKVEFDLSFSLGAVNEKQEITALPGAEPVEGLFERLGINPLELLEAGNGGGIGGLLEALGDELGEGSSGGGSGSGGETAECLKEAETASELQECATLLG